MERSELEPQPKARGGDRYPFRVMRRVLNRCERVRQDTICYPYPLDLRSQPEWDWPIPGEAPKLKCSPCLPSILTSQRSWAILLARQTTKIAQDSKEPGAVIEAAGTPWRQSSTPHKPALRQGAMGFLRPSLSEVPSGSLPCAFGSQIVGDGLVGRRRPNPTRMWHYRLL